jgi:hemerythrin
MALFEWQDSYSVGVAALDEQHKKGSLKNFMGKD